MKRILTIIKQDWTNILRDNLLFYIFMAPVIMAVAVRLLAPSIETVSVRVAVNEAMPQAIQENLTEFAKVFVVPDRKSIITRVEKNDDVPAFTGKTVNMRSFCRVTSRRVKSSPKSCSPLQPRLKRLPISQ